MSNKSIKQDYFYGKAPFVSLKKMKGVILNLDQQLERLQETFLNYYRLDKHVINNELKKIVEGLDNLSDEDQYIRITFSDKDEFQFKIDSQYESGEFVLENPIQITLMDSNTLLLKHNAALSGLK